MGMAMLMKVRDMEGSKTTDYPVPGLTRLQHDMLFVQLLGWFESDDYVYIAME
jgi:hypothetical protein